MTTPIPSPPSIPFLGHVAQIEKDIPVRSLMLLAKQYGGIYQLNILNSRSVVINSYDLLKDICDDKKFHKTIAGPLAEARNALGDGLFTAFHDEPNWAIAHRLIMPAFGTAAIRNMFDDMLDIISQLVLKWERFGPKYTIDPADDFTRMTLDAVALCSMSYRFNSFYRDEGHPFVRSMADFLTECHMRAKRPSFVTAMMRNSHAQYEHNMKVMADTADEIIADRKQNPIEKKDFLNTMLYSKDRKTGELLSDETIRNNLLTFLVAGHETTSGLLTFTLYQLIKKPEAMRKLREEIDEVLGDQVIQLRDLEKLSYTLAVLREVLRLNVPAAMRAVSSKEDTTIGGGKYLIETGVTIIANTWTIQRDPQVWGDDAEEFRPERMLHGSFESIPSNAWQPFGFGARACLGRAFAIQEAQIALACIVQKFDFVLSDPSYNLALTQSLTLRPDGFYIHAIPRAEKKVAKYVTPSKGAPSEKSPSLHFSQPVSGRHFMHVLYGSNTGTSECFAQRIASSAASYGFSAILGTLDSAVERLPTNGPVIIVTASFEGQPAYNAAHFVEWLENLKSNELANVRFAIFGCGNRDWARTFQRIPKLCDSLLEQHGGTRILARGEGDASRLDFFESFDCWEASLWKALTKEHDAVAIQRVIHNPPIQVKKIEGGTFRARTLRHLDANLGTVTKSIVLTTKGAPVKHHIEFSLPEETCYRAGDYLAILPLNPERTVQRAISRFNLSSEHNIVLTASGPTSLPLDQPINLYTLLSGYVELSQPATTRDLHILQETGGSKASSKAIQELSASYADNVLAKRLSVLDILEDYPDIKLEFGTFLYLLPSMRVRQYSISSSPLWDPRKVTLTVSIIDSPPISGRSESFQGVASTFLASLFPGNQVQLAVRRSAASFHPPQDPKTPMVMFCAGTGLAPMRGFIQERALQKAAGQEVGKMTLFFGCRRPSEDYLYSSTDLKEWIDAGVVDVRPAFSRASEESLGCKYVQDRIWHDRDDIKHAFKSSRTKFFTCGSRQVAQGVKETLMSIIREARGITDQEAAEFFEGTILERYATDIFE